MIRLPPVSTRTRALLPDTALFRSPLAPPARRLRPSRRQLDVRVAAGADTEETDRHAHLGFEEGDVVLGPLGQVAGLGGLAEVAPPPGEGLVEDRKSVV